MSRKNNQEGNYQLPELTVLDLVVEAGFVATGDPGEAGGNLDYDEPSNF